MTHKVISLTSHRAGTRVQSSAQILMSSVSPGHTAPACGVDKAARQAAIENALTMALYFVRQPGDTAANLWAATARANRALTLLKQASGGAVVLSGRA